MRREPTSPALPRTAERSVREANRVGVLGVTQRDFPKQGAGIMLGT